ncbi:hypothetical protein SLS58_005004 [Diplodia intermedia]|uniref:Uncharacterized protein n=1 Tax=Diplodia intermedia TaxID=856260 RepID=A0ABR3TS70_9PEZI
MSGNQAPLRAAGCASAGTAYPPITTPTIVPPSNPCIFGYTAGTLQSTYTLPSNLTAVLPLISSFGNIAWTGLIDPSASSAVLNGTDNEPGTARSYTLADGATLVETLLDYSSSPASSSGSAQLVEIHSIAHLYQPLDRGATNVSLTSESVQYAPPNGTFGFYAARDGMRVAGACGGGQAGAATTFDFSAEFCATDAAAAARWFRSRNLNAMATLGRMLGTGAENVTDCASLAAGGGGGSVGSADEPSSAASHQQIRMSMGTAR